MKSHQCYYSKNETWELHEVFFNFNLEEQVYKHSKKFPMNHTVKITHSSEFNH